VGGKKEFENVLRLKLNQRMSSMVVSRIYRKVLLKKIRILRKMLLDYKQKSYIFLKKIIA
jgi:hypothetical protein